MLSAFPLPTLTFAFSLQRVFERQGHPRAGYGLTPCLLGELNDSTNGSDHPRQDAHPTSNSQRDVMRLNRARLDANGRERLAVKWFVCPFDPDVMGIAIDRLGEFARGE